MKIGPVDTEIALLIVKNEKKLTQVKYIALPTSLPSGLNQCVKFEVSSFSHSGDILGRSKKLSGSCDHNHALFGDDFLFVWQDSI